MRRAWGRVLLRVSRRRRVRRIVDVIPDSCWHPALQTEGGADDLRDGAWVAEATGMIDLNSWPAGSRLILRRERPHPGAQLTCTDADGLRITATLCHRAACATAQPVPTRRSVEVVTHPIATSRPPVAATLGELRASGHGYRPVKHEMRNNLVAAMRSGKPRFDGIVGYDDTVLPELERALLAGHDMVLLGERGQGKTRLARSLVDLLDEWTPVVEGSEIHEHPDAPVTPWARRMAAEMGDDLPITWLHRSMRYGEKLATPDTSVGDLVGDVDPTKVAEGRRLGDPETVHYGLVPRTNRGIFVVNELPDLAERIQVALLNVLEERDIQVRGYSLRLPLDLLLVATANPEDYTNRGRIITPLKDRFGAEVRTHYPLSVDDEVDLVRQEAELVAAIPEPVLAVIAHFARGVRASPAVDQRSGVSARFAVACAEAAAASALRRGALTGEAEPVVRVSDVAAVVPTLRGKVEFEMGHEGRERDVLDHLVRVAVADVFRERLRGHDLTPVTDRFAEGATVEDGDMVASSAMLAQLGPVPGLARLLEPLGMGEAVDAAEVASGVELVLEGLHLTRRLAKDVVDDGHAVYSA